MDKHTSYLTLIPKIDNLPLSWHWYINAFLQLISNPWNIPYCLKLRYAPNADKWTKTQDLFLPIISCRIDRVVQSKNSFTGLTNFTFYQKKKKTPLIVSTTGLEGDWVNFTCTIFSLDLIKLNQMFDPCRLFFAPFT